MFPSQVDKGGGGGGHPPLVAEISTPPGAEIHPLLWDGLNTPLLFFVLGQIFLNDYVQNHPDGLILTLYYAIYENFRLRRAYNIIQSVVFNEKATVKNNMCRRREKFLGLRGGNPPLI